MTGPILCLDFDGCLHPAGCDPSRYFECLPRLEAVLRDFPDVRIVLSSSWQDAYSIEALRRRFSGDIGARIIGGTREADPDGEAENRFEEIRAYLLRAGESRTPWLALDDAADEFPDGCPELVLCDPALGFDDQVAAGLRRRLAAL